MLSCLKFAGGVTAGVHCCRLARFHQPVSRVRRYPSDVTDAQWAVLDRLLPDPAWLAGRGGRRDKHCRRVIVDPILYVVDNGIKWRALPADFPPWPTVYKRFAAWEKTGTTQRLLDGLRDQARLSAGRVAAPSAAVMDSQSVCAAETVSRATRGYDAGKKVQGRKRHIVVDTAGFLLAVLGYTCLHTRQSRRPSPATPRDHHRRPPATGLGRRRLHRHTARLGTHHPRPDRAGRATPRPTPLHDPPPPMGGGTNPRLDHPTPPLRPRLRTPPPTPPRSHGPLGHDPHHHPPPNPIDQKQALRATALFRGN